MVVAASEPVHLVGYNYCKTPKSRWMLCVPDKRRPPSIHWTFGWFLKAHFCQKTGSPRKAWGTLFVKGLCCNLQWTLYTLVKVSVKFIALRGNQREPQEWHKWGGRAILIVAWSFARDRGFGTHLHPIISFCWECNSWRTMVTEGGKWPGIDCGRRLGTRERWRGSIHSAFLIDLIFLLTLQPLFICIVWGKAMMLNY